MTTSREWAGASLSARHIDLCRPQCAQHNPSQQETERMRQTHPYLDHGPLHDQLPHTLHEAPFAYGAGEVLCQGQQRPFHRARRQVCIRQTLRTHTVTRRRPGGATPRCVARICVRVRTRRQHDSAAQRSLTDVSTNLGVRPTQEQPTRGSRPARASSARRSRNPAWGDAGAAWAGAAALARRGGRGA